MIENEKREKLQDKLKLQLYIKEGTASGKRMNEILIRNLIERKENSLVGRKSIRGF